MTTEKKKDETEFQRLCSEFVEKEIYANQNMLIEECFSKDIMFIEDIENYFPVINMIEEGTEYDEEGNEIELSECMSCADQANLDDNGNCCDCQSPQEILEWWIVSNWLADKLKEKGQPVLDNAYGVYWGRTTSGQAIMMDGIIKNLVREYWC